MKGKDMDVWKGDFLLGYMLVAIYRERKRKRKGERKREREERERQVRTADAGPSKTSYLR